ncbi:MAG: hypothetical protein AAFY54_11025 [Cyanobacteria bacterium J06648_10]
MSKQFASLPLLQHNEIVPVIRLKEIFVVYWQINKANKTMQRYTIRFIIIEDEQF